MTAVAVVHENAVIGHVRDTGKGWAGHRQEPGGIIFVVQSSDKSDSGYRKVIAALLERHALFVAELKEENAS